MGALEGSGAAATVKGFSTAGLASVIQAKRYGDQSIILAFEDLTEAAKYRLVVRDEEPIRHVKHLNSSRGSLGSVRGDFAPTRPVRGSGIDAFT